MELVQLANTLSSTISEWCNVSNKLDHNQSNQLPIHADLSICIHIYGDFNNQIIAALPEAIATKLTSILTQRKVISLINPHITDAMGELLNVAVGATQNQHKLKFKYSVPEILKRKNHEVIYLSSGFDESCSLRMLDSALVLFMKASNQFEDTAA